MNYHRNARLTFHNRVLLVTRVIEQGQRPTEATRSMGISTRTACKWLKRYREESAAGNEVDPGDGILRENAALRTANKGSVQTVH